jgi:hypothetical protein
LAGESIGNQKLSGRNHAAIDRSSAMKTFADKILSLRDVKHGKFVLTSTAKDLP